MQDPEPPKQPSRWVPNQKTVGGAIIGQLFGQFIVLAADQYLSKKPSPELAIAFTGLIQALCSYFIPSKSTGD